MNIVVSVLLIMLLAKRSLSNLMLPFKGLLGFMRLTFNSLLVISLSILDTFWVANEHDCR